MRKVKYLLCLAAVLALAGCGEKQQSEAPVATPTEAVEATVTPTVEPTETPEPTATPKPTATPTPEVDWKEKMLNDSIVSTGNNARLKKVLEKARNGETVNIAILGGSITEGGGASQNSKGYAYLFETAFKETYGNGDNINFVNAGLSGTPSCLGAIRYKKDVLDVLGAEPDLFIIEFAVNDWNETTGTRAYESLVHDVLSQENNAAVILLFSSRDDFWNVQDNYIPVGKHYDLPMVSVVSAIKEPMTSGKLAKNLFYTDSYHPANYGHRLMCDYLMNLLAVIDAEEAEELAALPDTGKKGLEFKHVVMLESGVDYEGITVSPGSFTAQDTEIQHFGLDRKPSFPNNWMRDAAAGNESFTMTLTCKNLMLNYKTANNQKFGEADIFVDGEYKMTLNCFSAGGWNNNNVILIIDEKEAAEHTVEIRMKEGQEDKSFTILCFGYTE